MSDEANSIQPVTAKELHELFSAPDAGVFEMNGWMNVEAPLDGVCMDGDFNLHVLADWINERMLPK